MNYVTEKFSAILGLPIYCPYVVPTYLKDMCSQYHHFLDISEKHFSNVIVRDEVEFMSLISYFQREDRQALEGVHR